MSEPRPEEENSKQLLIGMYEVFDPNPGNPNAVVGMAAVFENVSGTLNTTEHWAFSPSYRPPALNQSLRVKRTSMLRPSQADWDRFTRFFLDNPGSTYVKADCRVLTPPASGSPIP
jgi:hypothetical protein